MASCPPVMVPRTNPVESRPFPVDQFRRTGFSRPLLSRHVAVMLPLSDDVLRKSPGDATWKTCQICWRARAQNASHGFSWSPKAGKLRERGHGVSHLSSSLIKEETGVVSRPMTMGGRGVSPWYRSMSGTKLREGRGVRLGGRHVADSGQSMRSSSISSSITRRGERRRRRRRRRYGEIGLLFLRSAGIRRWMITIMGGKKKSRKLPSKGQPDNDGPSNLSSAVNPPARITSNIRLNLHYVKLLRKMESSSGGGGSGSGGRPGTNTIKPSTSYRKKRKLEDDEDAELEYALGNPDAHLYHTNDGLVLAPPVLLVDGYNVCGFWPKLKKHFMRGNLAIARDKLIEEMTMFGAIKSVKVVVVFDAVLSGLPSHKEENNNVDIIYSAESCADSWIEKEAKALTEDGCPRVWVVTSDRAQQAMALGSGAFVWSCSMLIAEMKDARKQLQEALQEERPYSWDGKLLEHNLDRDTYAQLQDLKQSLNSCPSEKPSEKG